jgi:hypothetical protein
MMPAMALVKPAAANSSASSAQSAADVALFCFSSARS